MRTRTAIVTQLRMPLVCQALFIHFLEVYLVQCGNPRGLRSGDCSVVRKKVVSKRIDGHSAAGQVWLLVKYVSFNLLSSQNASFTFSYP